MITVYFNYSFQCSPTDWECVTVMRHFHESDTLADVKEWVRLRTKADPNFRLFEIKIQEADK